MATRQHFHTGPVASSIQEGDVKVLDAEAKQAVQAVIDSNMARLHEIPGFVSTEPGFPIVDGAVRREPAIIVFVSQKKPPTHLLEEERAPRQLGPFRVSVMQADPLAQVEELMSDSPIAGVLADSAQGLTYKRLDGNPIEPLILLRAFSFQLRPPAVW